MQQPPKFLIKKNNELDQLADFLGNKINVHREYYRLPEATIQVTNISKLLLALEKGKLTELKGKSLDEIQGAVTIKKCLINYVMSTN